MIKQMPRPAWQPLALTCAECGADWDDWQPVHVPLDTWIAHALALRCPDCAGSSLRIRRSTEEGYNPDA